MKIIDNTIAVAVDDEENLKKFRGREVKGVMAKPFTRKMELEIKFDLGKAERKSVESQTDKVAGMSNTRERSILSSTTSFNESKNEKEKPLKRVGVKRQRPVGPHVPKGTRILMRSFEGIWKRKCHDNVHYFVMDPLFEYIDNEKKRRERCFRKTLHYLLMRDDAMISECVPEIPEDCEITSDARAMLFNWLISVQQYFKVPTEAVHIATTLVDRYIWRHAVHWDGFQLLGMAALCIGVKCVTQRSKLSLSRFVKLCECVYNESEVLEEESKLLSIFAPTIDGPIPHWFLGYALIGWYDLPSKIEQYIVIMMCRYIFDQGLTEMALSRYSASLRCAASIYLVRRLLRLSCRCSSNGAIASCEFHTIKPWTKALIKLTGHKESPGLRRAAYLYGLMLIEAQFMAHERGKLTAMQGCANKYEAAFRKFSQKNSGGIALDPVMLSFTASDIADLDNS